MTRPLHLLLILFIACFHVPCSCFHAKRSSSEHKSIHLTNLRASLISDSAASILSGSLAGAIGVGVAFPFDSIKTKQQALSTATGSSPGFMKMIPLILKNEGVQGFYVGVVGTMIGQSLIKATAFFSNSWALSVLEMPGMLTGSSSRLLNLIIAACFSGFVTSFLVAPIERVKILMQTDTDKKFKNELDCALNVIRTEDDGIFGLVFRGLGATFAREIPGYGFYFFVYSFLQDSVIGNYLAPLGISSLVCGAMAGISSWIPVYPIDVVKTAQQNTQGQGNSKGFLETASELNGKYGVGVFFDGLGPKLVRAAVNHAVTFFAYDSFMSILQSI